MKEINLNEVGAFYGRFTEKHAIVAQDAHRIALDVGESADQRGAVAGLKLVKA